MSRVEWGTAAVLLLGAALLAALTSETVAEAQQAESEELQLTESRNSGVSGIATLRDAEGGVEVTVTMQELPEAGVEHLNHIHAGGTCAEDRAGRTAPVTLPLNTIVSEQDGTGSATTTIEDVTLDQLFEPSEDRFILVHAKTEEGGGIPPGIACADFTTTVTGEVTTTKGSTRPLPSSGGLEGLSMLLPVAAALVGLCVLSYAVLRRG